MNPKSLRAARVSSARKGYTATYICSKEYNDNSYIQSSWRKCSKTQNLKNTITMIFKSIKEKAWQKHVKKMQRELDKIHAVRDYYNKLNKTCYTTKQALELAYKNDL